MFSANRAPELVKHYDGVFTKSSATARRRRQSTTHSQYNLISFLSIVQKLEIQFLPILWQPTLGPLGKGGSAMISQSEVTATTSLAFKRFTQDGDPHDCYLSLLSEVLILSQPPIRHHPNIVDLEGICWEIDEHTHAAVPVLVFEKAAWDLENFFNSEVGGRLNIDDRLEICAAIGNAIWTLHKNDTIHGDIKPSNVLVFDRHGGRPAIKVADFASSSVAAGVEAVVLLPRSRPWNAPEHEFKEFSMTQAKAMDIYSFGMLSFWILFGSLFTNSAAQITDSTEPMTFHVSSHLEPPTLLERLKNNDEIAEVSCKLAEALEAISEPGKAGLKIFFSSTLARDPNRRILDMKKLIKLLHPISHGLALEPPILQPDAIEDIFECTDFRIARNLYYFAKTDYRVREQIKRALEEAHSAIKPGPSARSIAFQLAFCYHIGFGVRSDYATRDRWLKMCGCLPADIDAEKEMVILTERDVGGWPGVAGDSLLLTVNLAESYRFVRGGQNDLKKIHQVYQREFADMSREFGQLHFVPIAIRLVLGDLILELGLYEESKELWSNLCDEIEGLYGGGHDLHIGAVLRLMESYSRLGEFTESQIVAERLKRHLIDACGADSIEVAGIARHLAITNRRLGRYQEAKEQLLHALAAFEQRLCANHPHTLSTRFEVGLMHKLEAKLSDAEEQVRQVVEGSENSLGSDHPSTIKYLLGLCWIYRDQGKWSEAEKIGIRVLRLQERVFGPESYQAALAMDEHASTLVHIGPPRWEEAKELCRKALRISVFELGPQHLQTLIITANLAAINHLRGESEDAERQLVSVLGSEMTILGPKHPVTLACMENLAVVYGDLGLLSKVELLENTIVESKKILFGPDHPETLAGLSSRSQTLLSQGRVREAEEVASQVLEKTKRVLGESHPQTVNASVSLALALRDKGQLQEAANMLEEALQLTRVLMGGEHHLTLSRMGSLGVVYLRLGRVNEAARLLRQVTVISNEILGPSHPQTLTSMGNLAQAFGHQGRWDEAVELEVQVLEKRKKVLNPTHPHTLASIQNLACMLGNQEKWEEAGEMFCDLIKIQKDVLGSHHSDTLHSMNNLAQLFANQGEYEKAERVRSDIECIRSNSLRPEQPSAISATTEQAAASGIPQQSTEADHAEI